MCIRMSRGTAVGLIPGWFGEKEQTLFEKRAIYMGTHLDSIDADVHRMNAAIMPRVYISRFHEFSLVLSSIPSAQSNS